MYKWGMGDVKRRFKWGRGSRGEGIGGGGNNLCMIYAQVTSASQTAHKAH